MDKAKTYWKVILIVVLALGLVISILARPNGDNVTEFLLQQRVDSLELAINNFPAIRESIEQKHKEDTQLYLDSIASLNKLMIAQNKQITDIDEEVKKRLNDLVDLDSTGVSSYFTNRYK